LWRVPASRWLDTSPYCLIALFPYSPTALIIMPEQLIATAGVWFFAACAALFVLALVEQAGAPRSPEDDAHRKSALTTLLILASFLPPVLLLLHGSLLTTGADSMLRAAIIAAPVAAMLIGSLLGAFLGALAGRSAIGMRRLVPPLVLVALALALYTAHPSIGALFDALQDGVLELPVRPV